MGTLNPNQTLLQGAHQSVSDKTPAPLTGAQNQVSFEFHKIQPPSILYIQRDDVMVLQAATSAAAEVVTFNLRILLPNGRVEETQQQLRPAANRTVLTATITLSEGYLLSLACQANVAVTRGQTFARAFLNRSIFGATQSEQTIFADYVTTLVSSGYPNGRILAPTEGPGLVYSFVVANPAAGLDWSQTVPVNSRWRVRSWSATFTASAAAGNRVVGALVAGVGGTVWLAEALANVVANGLVQVSAGGIQPYTSINTSILLLPLPPDLVLTGSSLIPHSLGSQTFGILAGDTWQAIHLLVEEWLDNV